MHSLSQGHIFLPPEARCIRVSNLSFVPLNTLFTRFYCSLFLFLTSVSLLILPSTLLFQTSKWLLVLIPHCCTSSPLLSFLCSHLPSLSIKRRSGNTGKTVMSFLKCKLVPYIHVEKSHCSVWDNHGAGSRDTKKVINYITVILVIGF